MQKAILVGASSGIGAALARLLAGQGYELLLLARRTELLQELQCELGAKVRFHSVDVTDSSGIIRVLDEAFVQSGPIDLVVILAGTGEINPNLDWMPEEITIQVNVTGFTAVATTAMRHFLKQGRGHLVNISSIAAHCGNPAAPAYNASKAFASNYMQGLQQKVLKARLPITVTDVQPGFVKTAMAKGEKFFWMASPEKAAAQIYQAVLRKRQHAYVTKRWRLVAWLFKLAPTWLLANLS